MTDEGLCCVFNTLNPDFLYNGKYVESQINSYSYTYTYTYIVTELTNIFHFRYNIIKDLTNKETNTPVNWNPETGYPANLPDRYYPRPAAGL